MLKVLLVAQILALIFVRRDWQTMMLLVGLLLNVVFNSLLKIYFSEHRPLSVCSPGANLTGSLEEFGMPSNHAQFMGFFAVFVSAFLYWKVDVPRLERAFFAALAVGAALLVAASRIHLGYHSQQQVTAGLSIGAFAGLAWFGLYIAVLEPLGREVVRWRLARWLLIRETSKIRNVLLFEYETSAAYREK
jgi:dolichyldiphosphatase